MTDSVTQTATQTTDSPNADRFKTVSTMDEDSESLATKCVPFYGDVYGSSFVSPLINFANFSRGSIGTEDSESPISVLSSELFHQRPSFYQAVPTEETSVVGRERAAKERRKQSQSLRKKKAQDQCFTFTSAVCGISYDDPLTRPFSLLEFVNGPVFQPEGDKIRAVRADEHLDPNMSMSSAALPGIETTFEMQKGNTDVANIVDQLVPSDVLKQDSSAPGDGSARLCNNTVSSETNNTERLIPSATPIDSERNCDSDQIVLESKVVKDSSEVRRNKDKPRARGRKQRNKRSSESLQNNGIGLNDDEDESMAVFVRSTKRRPSTKEGAYKRDKTKTELKGPSSRFRGVTRHRRSGRWEAHIWIKEIGRQVYLGGYEKEEHAAEAYDIAAIKSKGGNVKTNFESSKYNDLAAVMDSITLDELVMIVRRKSQGFSRGTSQFRGVTHHPSGRWEARIGIPDPPVLKGSKHIYLGLYNDEYEAAKWYDRALVRLRGPSAATNFLLSNYRQELAEFNSLQQAVLADDGTEKDGVKLGPNFEHWVKFGTNGVLSSAEMDLAAEAILYDPTPQQKIVQDAQPDAEDETANQKKQLIAELIMRSLTETSEQDHQKMDMDYSQCFLPSNPDATNDINLYTAS